MEDSYDFLVVGSKLRRTVANLELCNMTSEIMIDLAVFKVVPQAVCWLQGLLAVLRSLEYSSLKLDQIIQIRNIKCLLRDT